MKTIIKQLRAHPAAEIMEDALSLGAVGVMIVMWFSLS
jgi:hypothetical protein